MAKHCQVESFLGDLPPSPGYFYSSVQWLCHFLGALSNPSKAVLNWHHQGIALTRFQPVYVLALNKPPMFAEEPDFGRKNHPQAWADVCRRRPWRSLSGLLWSYSSFLLPAPTNPREPNNTLCLDMGTLENGYLQWFHLDWQENKEHRMVLKCTLWLKAWKWLASGQAMRMNNNILGQRRCRTQLLPAIISLF